MTGNLNRSTIHVEVVYALADEQILVALDVQDGTTARQAIEATDIPRRFPGMELGRARIGIFGRVVEPNTRLRDGDRVEIYRPLLAEPKEARRARAKRRG